MPKEYPNECHTRSMAEATPAAKGIPFIPPRLLRVVPRPANFALVPYMSFER